MKTYRDDIIKLRSEGMTYNQISKALKCSRSVVCYHLGDGQRAKKAAKQVKNRKIIQNYIKELKTKTPCTDCNVNYPYWVMDFDHLENKRFSINQFYQAASSFNTIKNEIAKCEIVCANCHRTRTHTRKYGT